MSEIYFPFYQGAPGYYLPNKSKNILFYIVSTSGIAFGEELEGMDFVKGSCFNMGEPLVEDTPDANICATHFLSA